MCVYVCVCVCVCMCVPVCLCDSVKVYVWQHILRTFKKTTPTHVKTVINSDVEDSIDDANTEITIDNANAVSLAVNTTKMNLRNCVKFVP